MPYHRMAEEVWQGFLRHPARPAMLATVRTDGRPHLAPVWYDLDDDGTVVFNTSADSVKGKAILRDPRVALCVQDDQPPFSYVLVQGAAEVSDDPGELRRWATRIAGRYMGAERAEAYGARNAVPPELVVRVRPQRVTAVENVAD